MRKRTLCIAAGLLLLFSNRGLPAQNAQTPAQLPNRFEIYYEFGMGGSGGSDSVEPGHYDAFDSAKKERTYDAMGGQVKYQTELSESERKAIYDAIQQNNLLAVKNEFTNLGDVIVDPGMVGRLRIEIAGSIKEIRFKWDYGRVFAGNAECTRLRNVLDVIEDILKAKDQNQTLPRHNVYF